MWYLSRDFVERSSSWQSTIRSLCNFLCRELWSLMDIDDSLSLTLSELDQGINRIYYWQMDIKDDPISGIPKLTGTMDIFDGYPAVLAAYNLGHYENTDHVQLMRTRKSDILPVQRIINFSQLTFPRHWTNHQLWYFMKYLVEGVILIILDINFHNVF